MLAAVNDYWRLMLNPEDTARDTALIASIKRRIASGEAWVSREPNGRKRGSNLGGVTAQRRALRGLRGQYLRRPETASAFTIRCSSRSRWIVARRRLFRAGPVSLLRGHRARAARIISMLMFLPGGDRAGGLREMEQTRSRGMLLRGEADYQLHLIYLWYERQHSTALRLIEGLRTRYPHNPVFYLRLADVQGNYVRNHQSALQTYRSMLDAARAGRIASPVMSEVHARLGIAQELDALCDSDGAIEQLNAVIAQKPAAPYSALARAYYQLGVVHDRAGRRSDAIAAYQRAQSAIPRDDRLHVSENVRAATRRAPATRVCR